MSLPSSMADFVPCDRLLQKAYSSLFFRRNSLTELIKFIVAQTFLLIDRERKEVSSVTGSF